MSTPHRQRLARLYCIGTGKSGTHSIASMFSHPVHAIHESDADVIISYILDRAAGRLTKERLSELLTDRDKRLMADVDSSNLNLFLLDVLLEIFPEARFVLTVRDCYSWMNSFFNQSLILETPSDMWKQFRVFRFGTGRNGYAPEEALLREKGFYPLRSYLAYWAEHNRIAISTVPQDRLLIVKTHEITKRAYDIAEFASLPRDTIILEKTHDYAAKKDFGILRQLPRGFVEACVEETCAPLMKTLFPDIESMDDARL